LASELNLGYLDDVTLGGPVDTVASDVAENAKVHGRQYAANPELLQMRAALFISISQVIGCEDRLRMTYSVSNGTLNSTPTPPCAPRSHGE